MAIQQFNANGTVATTPVGSAALTPNGQSMVQTAQVINSMQGDKQLIFSIAAVTAETNVILFPGVWRKQSERKLATDGTFTCDGFNNDFEAMSDYFRNISTIVSEIRMETNNVANYLSTLNFTEKDPTGDEHTVKTPLSPLRINSGNGYSETLIIKGKDLQLFKWPGLEVTFSSIAANSYINFYFKLSGWNKPIQLAPIQSNIIS